MKLPTTMSEAITSGLEAVKSRGAQFTVNVVAETPGSSSFESSQIVYSRRP